MENANYKLGDVIKEIRTKKGIQAKFVANELKIHPSTLCKYESNTRNINADQLPKLAEALGCKVADFFAQNVGETPKQSA